MMMEGVEQSQARTSDFGQLQKEYRLMEMNRKVLLAFQINI